MRVRTILLLLLSTLTACAADSDEEAIEEQGSELAARSFTAITHNIAGGMISKGDPVALDKVSEEAGSSQADVVMLQEVCASQVEALKKRFPKWDVRFAPMIPVEDSCGNQPLGNVLASRWNMSEMEVTDLGTAFGRNFSLLCADLAKPGFGAHGVRACVTHLRAWNDADAEPMRIAQTAKIHDTLAPRIEKQGQAVVVAGDFNSGPHREPMNNIYRQAIDGKQDGKGLFREADQNDDAFFAKADAKCAAKSCRSGEGTTGQSAKLDYVFFSLNRARGSVEGTVMGKGTSDHGLLRAVAKLSGQP
jgi:endonuclease/exonuclease/phosphatase family metal-dependent hydrolase